MLLPKLSLLNPASMRLITTIHEMRSLTRVLRQERRSLGLIPTMGALHDGHLSLVRRACQECDAVVVSVFVNPSQFSPGEDFRRYPRDLRRDLELLARFRVAAVFVPDEAEIYPEGIQSWVDPGPLAELYEGVSRPGHFRGVATVVLKLFNIASPDAAFFGQKDFQQVIILRRLVRDLNLDVRLAVCPIVRDQDGLALSSRNGYLCAEERQGAPTLYRSLQHARELVEAGETSSRKIADEIRKVLDAELRVRLDYVEVVESLNLQPVAQVAAGDMALVAAWVGGTRLIDNTIFAPRGTSEAERLEMALRTSPIAEARSVL
jgi:pantoate--beta-alanine ligase